MTLTRTRHHTPLSAGATATAAGPTGLLNAYSTRNLGDAAIMTALTGMLPSRSSQAVINEDDAMRLSGVQLVRELSQCATFVSVGGDIFNNSRPMLVTRTFLNNVLQLKKNAQRTIVFGQTIPSSCGWLGLSLLASALRGTRAVVVRDRESQRILKRKGVAVELSHDSAFVLKPDQPGFAKAADLYAEAGLDPARTVVLAVRSFDALYPHDRNKFVVDMASLARALMARGHQVAAVIQSDVNADDTDRAVVAAIQGLAPGVAILDCLSRARSEGDETDAVATLIGVLTLANCVVAVRYHAAILRMVGGRQPYNLFYSRKGRDLQDRHGLAGCALESFDVQSAIAGIEATADQDFDVAPIAADVRQAFAAAYGKLA